ncbi:MAG: Ig-like domain-containing protein [Actinomycetales bacterium]
MLVALLGLVLVTGLASPAQARFRLAGPIPRSAAADAADTGISIPGNRLLWLSEAQLDTDLNAVKRAGVTWLRMDVAWSELESAPGSTDWARLDRVVDAATGRGLKVEGILTTMAPWARPAGSTWRYGPTSAAEQAAFASFAQAAAARYAGRIDVWEIWNEPNLLSFWEQGPNPGDYARLVLATAPAIKAGNPRAKVLSGGTGGAAWYGPTASFDIDSVQWYEQFYASGASGVVDGIAAHPYTGLLSADSGEMAQAKRIRAVMDAHGDGAKQLWGTEVGAPTGGENSLSEDTAATLMPQTQAAWDAIANTGPLFWYTLRDSDDPTREGYFGLLHQDGSAKPGYPMLQRMVNAPALNRRTDTTPPAVTITSPEPEALPAPGGIRVTATVSDDRAVANMRVLVNGTTIAVDTEAPYAITVPYGALTADQVNAITVLGKDAAGNVGSAGVRVRVPALEVGALEVTATSATATVAAAKPVVAQHLIVAMRDAQDRNRDVLLTRDTTLAAPATFSVGYQQLDPGTYRYWLAYQDADGSWRDATAPSLLVIP